MLTGESSLCRSQICAKWIQLQRRELQLLHCLRQHQNDALLAEVLSSDKNGRAALDWELAETVLAGDLSEGQVEAAISTLARFHAFSALSPELCSEALPPLTEPSPQTEFSLKRWLFASLVSLPECPYFHDNSAALWKLFRAVGFGQKVTFPRGEKPPIVLCHGNFCAENVHFQSRDGEPVAKLLNLELAHPGRGISDLAHFLLCSVNSSLRLHNLDRWLALYADTFETAVRPQNGGSTWWRTKTRRRPASVEQQRRQFHAVLPVQLMRALPRLAMEYKRVLREEQNGGLEGARAEQKKCALRGRMIGAFEMVRRELEQRR